ncbi:hypothetical protein AB7C87_06645 [Natrarchaeobius sp. A-rgal3]|uniref:hypothetical protein n=1 Tax=Natrarchaeobius versutus TaxID=1679078 RepID=UPI00350F66E7
MVRGDSRHGSPQLTTNNRCQDLEQRDTTITQPTATTHPTDTATPDDILEPETTPRGGRDG